VVLRGLGRRALLFRRFGIRRMSKTLPTIGHACRAACAAAFLAAGGANAGLVYSGIVDIAAPADAFGVYLNLLTGDSGTYVDDVPGWQFRVYGSTSLRIGTNPPFSDNYFIGTYPETSTLAGGRVVSLDVGSTISLGSSPSSMSSAYGWSVNEGSTGSATVGTAAGEFRLNADNYVGILDWRSQTEYFIGWIRIAVGSDITQRTVKDWFLSTGTSSAPAAVVTVGTIPAPGAVALLAAAGVVGSRRRRR
jgi:hypothetical protein